MAEDSITNAVIVDPGTFNVKAGLSTNKAPTLQFRNVCVPDTWTFGDEVIESLLLGGIDSEKLVYTIGKRSELNRDHQDHFEKLLSYIYSKLGADSSSSPLILVDHLNRSKESRERQIMIAMESFNVPAFLIQRDVLLNMYAAKVGTGLSVSIGHELTSILPFFGGDAIESASGTINMGGASITNYLIELLQKKYPHHNLGNKHFEAFDKVKRENCFFAQHFYAELQLSQETQGLDKSVLLPGTGQDVVLGAERFMAPEVLFKPSLFGIESLGLHDRIADAISDCPLDARVPLSSNIVIDSGLTKLPGFLSRLKNALENDADSFSEISKGKKVNLIEVPEHGAWKGAVELCNKDSALSLLISKEEYDESGPNIVHRRCF